MDEENNNLKEKTKVFYSFQFEHDKRHTNPKLYGFIKNNPFDFVYHSYPKRCALPKNCYFKVQSNGIFFDENEYNETLKRNKERFEEYKNWYENEFKKMCKEFDENQRTLPKKNKKYQDGLSNLNKELSEERILLHLNQNEIFFNLIESKKVYINTQIPCVVIELYLVNFDYKWLTETKSGTQKTVSERQKNEILSKFIKFLSLRILFATGQILEKSPIELMCVNIVQKWFDKALGNENKGITSSVQTKKNEIAQIDLTKIDIDKSYNHFKGLLTPSVSTPTNIRPIMEMNTDDKRIVSTDDVISRIDEDQNLALMDWEDFEHLVGQLFELEFSNDGSEVKVTQSSRDKGVDAIVFDPNPLKGGKYILQAKRYTNVVGVSAVRDLYGTIMNEGANRGILITTASYGPDAYEFAKNKPISLVDGPNLLILLNKHKMNYKIDLQEARNILDAKKN